MRLTPEQIQARMTAYDEVIGHLSMDVYDTPEERKQGEIVAKQIRQLALRFQDKYQAVIDSLYPTTDKQQ